MTGLLGQAGPPGSAAIPERRARVLIVDDDERNLLALTEVLSHTGEVVTARSGREALRLLLKQDFAVILLDVFMPGLDGYETAQLIRQRPQTSGTPIIFLSAVNKENKHLVRGYSMGAVDYVFKPVDEVMLKSKVSVFVDLHEMRLRIEEHSRAQRQLQEANHRAEIERLQIERALQLTQQRQAVILEALPMALYEEHLGEEGDPIRRFIGGDIKRLTGLDPELLAEDDHAFSSRIHPHDYARFKAALKSWTDQLSHEYRWIHADGSVRHFLDQRVPIPDERAGGTWAGTVVDITQQKELEAQLLQAGKLDAIGQLTGGIAHDFNNLLASIIGGIQLLTKRVPFGEREAKIVQHMQHAAERGAELVRRMMAFARRQDLSPTVVSSSELCEAVSGLVQHALGGTIELETDCLCTDVSLFVDKAQIELALVNLVLNARDAMPRGGTIRMEMTRESLDELAVELKVPAGEYVRIAVSDTGEGIPPDLLGKITEPFFTTKQPGKGTGLGLSMVFGFVNQSGGSLRIESELGSGTTIELYLPVSQAVVATEEQIEPAPRPAPASSVRSIVLVDDDEAVRSIVGEQLRDHGFTVRTFSNGSDALEQIRADPDSFDMLITDFAMPNLNGVDTIAQASELSVSMKFLLMTGFADEDALTALGDSVLVVRKPVKIEEIVALMT